MKQQNWKSIAFGSSYRISNFEFSARAKIKFTTEVSAGQFQSIVPQQKHTIVYIFTSTAFRWAFTNIYFALEKWLQSKSVYLLIIYFLVIRNRFHKLIRPGQQIACSQSLMRRNSFLKTPGGIRSKHTLKRLFTQFILLFCSASQRKKAADCQLN